MGVRLKDKNGILLQIGDKVRRVDGKYNGMSIGGVATIIEFQDDLHIKIAEYSGGHGVKHFVKDKEMNEI